MNLRQRLAAILVTTIMFTSIPVMAISKNTILNNTEVSIGQEITTDSAIKLNIKYKEPVINEEVIYLSAYGFKFDDEYYTKNFTLHNDVVLQYLDKDMLKVILAKDSNITELNIPLIGKVVTQYPRITVDSISSQTSMGTYTFHDLTDLLGFRIGEYNLLQEGETTLNTFLITNVVEDIFLDNKHIFELDLLSDEWEFVEGKVEVLEYRGGDTKFVGNIKDNNLIINKVDEWDIISDSIDIMVDGIKIKSCVDPVTNGMLELNIDSENMENKVVNIGKVSSNQSPINLNVQDKKIFELNGATQSSRIYFTSDRIELPNELKININGGIIHDYDVVGDYESIQTSNNEIMLVKSGSSDGLAIDMQIQGSKVGELTVSATSPQINGTLNGIIGEVVKLPTSSSSCNCSGSSTTIIEKTIKEKIDEALIEKIVEEKLNELIESYEIEMDEHEVETKEYHEFTDVDENDWYYESVKKAYEIGLITGYDDETFRPYESVSRAELITVIVRLLELNNK